MKLPLEHSKTIYNYHSAKKIYFSATTSKYYLFEKEEHKSSSNYNLLSRNPIITYSKTGAIIYPNNNK